MFAAKGAPKFGAFFVFTFFCSTFTEGLQNPIQKTQPTKIILQ